MNLNDVKKLDSIKNILRDYNGINSYMVYLRNLVFAYNKTLSPLQMEYVEKNKDFEPRYIGKTVHISQWWGEKKQEEWGIEFTPEKLFITWYLGETENAYVFYCLYRKSVTQATLVFAPKMAIWENFFQEDYHNLDIDFQKYNDYSGRTLKPHQEEAIKFLVSRKRAILADDMGYGKTCSSIVASLESNYQHILVICPASVKTTWKRELSFYVPEEDIEIVNGSTWKDAKYTILNYDILDNFYEVPSETYQTYENDINSDGKIVRVKGKTREKVSRKNDIISKAMEHSQLYQSQFDLIIIDEAHKLSNKTSGRYKICNDLIKRSNPIGLYLVTGTPITNKPMNLYNILKLMDEPIVKDYQWFIQQFCGGKQIYASKPQRDKFTGMFLAQKRKSSWYELTSGEKDELKNYLDRYCKKIWITNDNTNLEELQLRVKHLYLRRDKEELNNMVKKTIFTKKYNLTPQEKREYDNIWNTYLKSQNGIKDLQKLIDNRNMTEGMQLRQWLATKMIPHTIELANEIISKGEKVVIFCAFDYEINTLKEAFGDIAVLHNGKITTKKKDKAVDSFQNDDNVKVFLGNIISAGVGLTLVASNNVIFNNFDWVSGNNLQAMDRCHRLNQTKDVNVYFQVFNGTFYEEMLEKVNAKQDVINQIIITEQNK